MKIESIEAAHAMGTAESLLVCLWRTETTRTAIAKLKPIAARLVAANRGGIAMITVVEANADMPDADVRAELTELFRSLSGSVICSGLVFEGQGFRAATVRGITTGINLVARQPFPHKVFATVAEASVWMAGHSAAGLTASAIADHVRSLRSALDARSESRDRL